MITGEEAYALLKSKIDAPYEEINQKLEELEPKIAEVDDINAKLKEVEPKLDAIPEMQEQIAEIEPKITEIETAQQELEQKAEAIELEIAELRDYTGYTSEDILGVQVDYENKTFERLGGAKNKEGGADFDIYPMYGGRKRCTVDDSGTITSWYGDEDYKDDGTKGQVMVYQPVFYYKVVPLKLEPQANTDGGYHIRKANYYISATPKRGFKRHPAFYDKNDEEIEYTMFSAYEACIYDIDGSEEGTGAYLLNDEQDADFDHDKLSSISGAKPASGTTQQLTRANTRKLAENRGEGWEQAYAATVSASQLLMLIEYASFNMQSNIGKGAVSKVDDGASSMTENTGGSASLGNASGAVNNSNEVQIVSYRGEENFWSDIYTWVDGMNEKNPDDWNSQNPEQFSGQRGKLYVANHSFVDDIDSEPYVDTGICPVYTTGGYISAFGYSEEFDWLFIPTENAGTSALPVSDYFWNVHNNWQVAALGGVWSDVTAAGAFYWNLNYASGSRTRYLGGRLVYVPIKQSTVSYETNIAAWQSKFTE